MGQTRPVQVFIFVTEGTIEENLLQTLSAKHDLAMAALNSDSEVSEVEMHSNMDELKSRLEVLLGAKPIAPTDETVKAAATEDAKRLAHRERVAAAGGELLGAAFQFLGELIAQQQPSASPSEKVVTDLRSRLTECVEEDVSGRQRLTITLPNKGSLDNLAQTLAKVAGRWGGKRSKVRYVDPVATIQFVSQPVSVWTIGPQSGPYRVLIQIFLASIRSPCPRKPRCPVVRFRPGCSTPSKVPLAEWLDRDRRRQWFRHSALPSRAPLDRHFLFVPLAYRFEELAFGWLNAINRTVILVPV